MKKAAIIVISGLILIAAFSFLIYPTRYKYQEVTFDGYNDSSYKISIRTDRITGNVEQYDEENGWIDAQ